MPSVAELHGRGGDFEPRVVEDTAYLGVIDEAAQALDKASVPYMFIGGLASSAYGRPRWTHDADIMVKPDDARSALDALEAAGFKTEETDPNWLYKGIKRGTLVDIIFRSKGDLYVDDEMLGRARMVEFKGRTLRLAPPEDLIVLKALVHNEDVPHHWHDALGILAKQEIDWDYLVMRALGSGTRRVLSLLIYAQSNDIAVPSRVVVTLHRALFES